MNHRIIVAGIGTEVGKTLVSAILAACLKGDYWKPIECGSNKSDTAFIKTLLDPKKSRIHPSAYSFKAPLSPHHAARLEGSSICIGSIALPTHFRPLIIESVGGIFVPLSVQSLTVDLFKKWNCRWVVVSRHYLGSINHTLLTLDALKRYKVQISGVVFNGEPNPDSEEAILKISNLPCIGRLLPEKEINYQTFQRYAKQWKSSLASLLH